jgi:hypothetical protein
MLAAAAPSWRKHIYYIDFIKFASLLQNSCVIVQMPDIITLKSSSDDNYENIYYLIKSIN